MDDNLVGEEPQSQTQQARNAILFEDGIERIEVEDVEQTNMGNAHRRRKTHLRSPYWSGYTEVWIEEGDPPVRKRKGKCNRCKILIAADSRINGTSGLKNHAASCGKKRDEAAFQTKLSFQPNTSAQSKLSFQPSTRVDGLGSLTSLNLDQQETRMCEKKVVVVEEDAEPEEEEEEEEVKFNVKLVTIKEKTKVLFAEAGSDFTDTLLSFLLLPLGTIVKILNKHCGKSQFLMGSLRTLYNGVENLDCTHFPTDDTKSLLLNSTCLGEDERPPFDRIFTETTASFIISEDLKMMLSVSGSVISTLSNLGIAITDMDGAETYDMAFGYNEIMALLWRTLINSNPLSTFLPYGSFLHMRRVADKGNAINHIGDEAISMNSKKMILKCMMQKSTQKLLFAQADDDFVSFIFGALTIPLGRVEWYLQSNTGLSTVDNLHQSISDNLCSKGVMTPETKDLLFKPALSAKDTCSNEYIPLNFDPSMNQNHVRGSRMYMVKDDLTVSVLSVTSSISVIKELKISLSDVEELELQVGLEEGLSILKAALTSTTALTDGLIKPKLKASLSSDSALTDGSSNQTPKKRPKLEC